MIDLRRGDCLELMKDIPDKSIDMILCDLPYGTTACKWDTVIPFKPLWEQYNRIIKDNGAIVLFGSEPFSSQLRMSNIRNYKYDWVWDKKKMGTPLNAKRQPLKIHENIMVFNKHNYYPIMSVGKYRKKGGVSKQPEITGKVDLNYSVYNNLYYPKSIIEFSNASQKGKVHPTQKPVELLEYLIKTYTNENETVLDNCMGSGSTGVACINTNRNFIGIELNEKYFEVAKNRIELIKECG
jgi:site-specific DNA-methyltransferase (adenine-specific)